MELGNLSIYTGPEKMNRLTLAEDSLAGALPVKAKGSGKVVWVPAEEQLPTPGSPAGLGTFDPQQCQPSSQLESGADRCAGRPRWWHSCWAAQLLPK